ncbi:MAG: hypothetical protein ABI767_02350 [Rhodanobacter sp.]
MAIPWSWKIGGGALALVLLGIGWNGYAEYRAQHQADEITRESEHLAKQNARLANEQARQKHAELVESLSRQRERRFNNYQQISDQARLDRIAEAARKEKQRQKALKVAASYMLAANQQCLEGTVIKRQGSSFSKAIGEDGHDIECVGRKATQPLR